MKLRSWKCQVCGGKAKLPAEIQEPKCGNCGAPLIRPQSKYKATRVLFEGLWFDSGKERDRFIELRAAARSGIIRELERQVPFELHAPDAFGNKIKLGKTVIDFRYQDDFGRTVLEDSKGFQTAESKWKYKHLEAEYGIRVMLS